MEHGTLATRSTAAPPDTAAAVAPPAGSSRARFAVVYAALTLILVGSVTALIVFGLAPIGSSSKWSSWRPASAGPLVMAKEIADHVGPEYEFANGDQLLAVVPSAPAVTAGTQTVGIIAVSTRASNGTQDVAQLDPGTAVMYTLCGLGIHCAIATGTPSDARGVIVRREALEVALYTFKYVHAVDSVLIYVPPTNLQGAPNSPILYFTRESLSGRLNVPLHDTLSLKSPPRAGGAKVQAQNDPTEKGLLDALTLPHFFASGLIELQVGGALLALVPNS
jgi:hypothetical protein